MSFEPEKFFIGLADFFAIFLPGAFVSYALIEHGIDAEILKAPLAIESAKGLTIFLFAAYVIGHFVFLLGAILDTFVYDSLRKCTGLGQVNRLADGKRLSWRLWRWIAKLLFGASPDRAAITAVALKTHSLQPLAAQDATNAFQWCRARLSKEHVEGAVEVHRFEAHSKFFRSFVVVLVIAVVWYAVHCKLWRALACLVLAALAAWRYIDQRFKSTQQAYWHVIALEAASERPTRYRHTGSSERAGGVVYRRDSNNHIEFLFVRSADNQSWILPKGQVELGERPGAAAVRDVLEESGFWARILTDKQRRPVWSHDADFPGGTVGERVHFYLMEMVEDTEKRARETTWLASDHKDVPKEATDLLAAAKQVLAKK